MDPMAFIFTVDKAVLGEEMEIHKYAQEASTLFGRDGYPSVFKVHPHIGNDMPFRPTHKQYDEEGDLQYVTYRQCNGCIDIKVFND